MSRSIRLVVLAALALVALAVPAAANAASATYVPTAPNFDTGIDVAAGDTLAAKATSDFNLCGGVNPCIGQSESGHITPSSVHPGGVFYIPDGGMGGGWYRIGGGSWTAFSATAGDRTQSQPVIATTSGRLYITTNDIRDDVGWCRCWADNIGTITATVTSPDADGDGVPDRLDAFPNDPNESVDSDGDGVGDNADAFDNDPNETVDTDGDGVGDNSDTTPNGVPATANQCKKGGWKAYGVFKNQGDCVSYVATKGKNQPAGR